MFCRNCGKEIQNDSRFCPACGQSVEMKTLINTYALKKTASDIDAGKEWSFLLLINTIIILLMTLSKWIRVESLLVDGYFDIFGLFNVLKRISEFGNVCVLYLIVFLYGITIFITFGICIIYSVKVFRSNILCTQKDDIDLCFLVMTILIVVYCVFCLLALGIFSNIENNFFKVSLSGKFYFVFALLFLNRFVLLPQIKKSCSRKKGHILYENEWFCEKCNCKNNLNDNVCKYCGRYR